MKVCHSYEIGNRVKMYYGQPRGLTTDSINTKLDVVD